MQDSRHLTNLLWLAQQQDLSYLHFWGHTERGQSVSKACLSQWYPAPIEVDGIRYATAEHWMMAGKARLFDPAMIDQILANSDPAAAKALGRHIKHFDDQIWQQHRFNLVMAGNLAKFSQHPNLQDFLLATGEQVLVEAAPNDRIWGIGLAESDPKAQQPSTWQGLNLLGFALMQVRERLTP
jgi:ribA/ribD-fused uncharacterized protein